MAATPDPAFLAREYNNRELFPDHPRHFARWQEDSARARATMTCHLDLPYGASPGERIDLFPARKGDGSVLLFIHGGYWRSLDKKDFSYLAPAWVDAGVSLAVVNYDLCPKVTIETIVQQMLRACAWLYRNAERHGMDEERLFVSGHSAGGHLAAMMLAALWPTYDRGLPGDLVKGALSISGVYDLRPLQHVGWLNGDLRLDEEGAFRLSPAFLPPATRAPLGLAEGGLEN
jgi:arylformamidase